jgi:hypothetical protein
VVHVGGISLLGPAVPSELLPAGALAFVAGVILVHVHRRSHPARGYSPSFAAALLFLPVLMAALMELGRPSAAEAFGLVGVLSLIGYRAMGRNARDGLHAGLAVAAGIGMGTAYRQFALAAVILYALGVLVSERRASRMAGGDLLLRFRLRPDERGSLYHEEIFVRYLRRSQLLRVRTEEGGRVLEYTYLVRPIAPEDGEEFRRMLDATAGIADVRYG